MNFLSHDRVLGRGSSPLTRVAAALPDLWTLLAKRPLPLSVLRQLDASPEPCAPELALGIRSHLQTDAIFHRHPEFHRRTDLAAASFAQSAPALRHAHIAAHVLVEMRLDRCLICSEPGIVERSYAAFTPETIATASRVTLPDPAMRADLQELLGRFVSSAFLAEYRTEAGLVTRMLRSLSRGGFEHPGEQAQTQLQRATEELTHELDPGSMELIDEVRSALATRLLELAGGEIAGPLA